MKIKLKKKNPNTKPSKTKQKPLSLTIWLEFLCSYFQYLPFLLLCSLTASVNLRLVFSISVRVCYMELSAFRVLSQKSMILGGELLAHKSIWTYSNTPCTLIFLHCYTIPHCLGIYYTCCFLLTFDTCSFVHCYCLSL